MPWAPDSRPVRGTALSTRETKEPGSCGRRHKAVVCAAQLPSRDLGWRPVAGSGSGAARGRGLRDRWTGVAVRAGVAAAWVSRRLGRGEGMVIGGRVTLALDHQALSRLAAGRQVVLVSGTNGKTTTAHLLAAALGILGSVAHNDSGANMADGAVTALATRPNAPLAVLEIDELHLARVADAVSPSVIVLLNLTRDQLDRGAEVGAVAASVRTALTRHPETLVVANLDDPVVVAAVEGVPHVRWVATGATWLGDAAVCPRCGRRLVTAPIGWSCRCGLSRPPPDWQLHKDAVRGPQTTTPVQLRLPGRFNLGNAMTAIAAADALGVPPAQAAAAMAELATIAHRYAVIRHGRYELHLFLAKNPASWAETLPLLQGRPALLFAVNAREADGRDTSWLWDVPFEELTPRPTVASGERAADVGLRLSYAEVGHHTELDPLAGLQLLPPGKVAVVANYTAFTDLWHRLARQSAQ